MLELTYKFTTEQLYDYFMLENNPKGATKRSGHFLLNSILLAFSTYILTYNLYYIGDLQQSCIAWHVTVNESVAISRKIYPFEIFTKATPGSSIVANKGHT